MPISPNTGTGSTEKSRYGGDNSFTDAVDEGATIVTGRVS